LSNRSIHLHGSTPRPRGSLHLTWCSASAARVLPVVGELVGEMTSPLRIPSFARLVLSYTLNELGDWLGAVALAVLVFDQTGDPLATTALMIASRFLPALVAPLLTAHVEQLALRTALPALYLCEAAGFGLLALTAGAFWLPLVLAITLVDGTLALSGRSMTRAAVAAVLKPAGALREGNGLLNMGFSVAGAAGPALAGVIVAGAGVASALALDALSFALIALILRRARSLPAIDPGVEVGWARRVHEGLRYVRGNATLRTLLALQAVLFIFFAAVVPIEVVYAKQALGAGDLGFGLLLAAWGAGMVAGSIVFARARSAPPRALILLSSALVGLAYLGTGAAGSLAVACATSALGGLGNGVQWVSVMTAVQEATPRHLQARVAGLLESIGAAMPGLGFLLGGTLTALLSARLAFTVAGAAIVAIVVLAAIPLWHSPRRGREPVDRAVERHGIDATARILSEGGEVRDAQSEPAIVSRPLGA